MTKYIILGVFVTVLTFVGQLIYNLGVFKSVEINTIEKPPLIMIYKDHVGPYHKIVPTIEEVEAWAKRESIDCHLTFGEFLDNPKEIEEVRLRSHAGCIVSSEPSTLPEGFKKQIRPATKYVQALFTGSPAVGPFKVYPKVFDFVEESRIKIETRSLEIYEVISPKEMKTEYLFPIL